MAAQGQRSLISRHRSHSKPGQELREMGRDERWRAVTDTTWIAFRHLACRNLSRKQLGTSEVDGESRRGKKKAAMPDKCWATALHISGLWPISGLDV